MVESLKKLDKKFLYTFGGIVAVLILFIVFAVVFKFISGPGNNYSAVEKKIVEAGKKYVKSSKTDKIDSGQFIVVSTETLVSEGHLKAMSKLIKDECTGQLTIMNNGGVMNYLPELSCSKYKTVTLGEKIIEDNLITEQKTPYDSGLYEQNGEYIFKGKSPNNYVYFGSTTWRIIKIDANGTVRLYKTEPEKGTTAWDNKYNDEKKKSAGINDYEYSLLLEKLNASYKGFKEENRKRIVAHDVCVGKRPAKNYDLSYDIDCAEILENQYISVFNTIEISMASLDEKCDSVRNGNCRNYNYFLGGISGVWTTIAVADNTYEVYTTSTSSIGRHDANTKNQYHWVVHVSGLELFKSGSGTKADPYMMG